MKRIVNKFTDEFKQKVALEYLETDRGIADLMKKYGIKGSSCITNWIRKFELIKPTERELEVQLEMSNIQRKTKLEKHQESKIKKLKDLLKQEQLKAEALVTLINIAEERLKIDIRKKSGSQR